MTAREHPLWKQIPKTDRAYWERHCAGQPPDRRIELLELALALDKVDKPSVSVPHNAYDSEKLDYIALARTAELNRLGGGKKKKRSEPRLETADGNSSEPDPHAAWAATVYDLRLGKVDAKVCSAADRVKYFKTFPVSHDLTRSRRVGTVATRARVVPRPVQRPDHERLKLRKGRPLLPYGRPFEVGPAAYPNDPVAVQHPSVALRRGRWVALAAGAPAVVPGMSAPATADTRPTAKAHPAYALTWRLRRNVLTDEPLDARRSSRQTGTDAERKALERLRKEVAALWDERESVDDDGRLPTPAELLDYAKGLPHDRLHEDGREAKAYNGRRKGWEKLEDLLGGELGVDPIALPDDRRRRARAERLLRELWPQYAEALLAVLGDDTKMSQ